MTLQNHVDFFNNVPAVLKPLSPDTKPSFGVMTATQMVDHITAGTRLFMRQKVTPLSIPEEFLPKAKAFLMSDKPFKPSAPKPDDYQTFEQPTNADIEELKVLFYKAFKTFDEVTKTDKTFWTFHPSFGKLDAIETRQLQYKHLRHHLNQFGLL